MITVECKDYNDQGIADLSEAVELARTQGIANARGGLRADALYPLLSLTGLIGMGMAQDIPGVGGGTEVEGIAVREVEALLLPDLLRGCLVGVEAAVRNAAGEAALPDWHPTHSRWGLRLVTMMNGSIFREHQDIYEGIVAAAQIGIDGEKTMHVEIDGAQVNVPLETGDIVLFGCDTFSEQPRRKHSFSFNGFHAVSFTIGQDPYYTISGNYPRITEPWT